MLPNGSGPTEGETGMGARQQWHREINGWLTWLTTTGASRETRRLRGVQLRHFAAGLKAGPWMVTARAVERWVAAHEWKPETRRSYISAVRSFYEWGRAHGMVEKLPTRTLPPVRSVMSKPRPAPEAAIDEALARADTRQHLMLMLGSRHGLRRGEIARVHTCDVIVDEDGGWTLRVHGKAGKEREVPLLDGVARLLRDRPAGWVFPNGRGTHLTAGHVGVLIGRALPKGVTPHMLRHRYATRVYRATLDLLTLQGLLGHSMVSTTQRYAAPDPAVRRRVSAAAA
jgi:integrase